MTLIGSNSYKGYLGGVFGTVGHLWDYVKQYGTPGTAYGTPGTICGTPMTRLEHICKIKNRSRVSVSDTWNCGTLGTLCKTYGTACGTPETMWDIQVKVYTIYRRAK